jgi:hypothetical protein
MLLRIAELLLRPLRPAQEQLRVALPGEAHAAVELHGPVPANLSVSVACALAMRQAALRIAIQGACDDQRRRVVDEGAAESTPFRISTLGA